MNTPVLGSHQRLLFCLLALLPLSSGGTAAAAEQSDSFVASSLTVHQAEAIAARQARKPSLNDVKDETVLAQRLEQAGIPAARIAEFQAAVRDLEIWPLLPTEPSYELRLLEFLLRTSDSRWLELAGEFKEVLYLPQLSSLTPEVAGRLVCRPDPADPQSPDPSGVLVVLPGLKRLEPDTARALCKKEEHGVVLPGITTLTPDVAAALAGGGLVSLPGLTTITPEAIRPLLAKGDASFAAVLLTGLDQMPPPLAQALSETPKLVVIRGLQSFDAATADLLAGNGMINVDLGLIRELTPSLAARLANRHGDGMLRLRGVTELSATAAEQLAGCTSGVSLPGLTTLSPEAASVLARCQSGIELPGLTTIAPELGRALATCSGEISLPGLASLPPGLAAALPMWKGFLSLGGLRTLSVEDAATLATTTASLRLPGVTKLPAAVATKLGQVRWLELSGLQALDAETAAALASGPGILRLDGLARLEPEAARGLAGRRDTLMLYGLTGIDAATATALATCGADLRLQLTTLTPEAAEALAAHRGQVLLPALADPPPEVADRLLQNDKILFDLGCYASRKTLSPKVATALAKRQEEISLDGLVALESRDAVAIARALATKQGPLALPNLKKLSPKTLLALAEKEDLELPPIDDLELIPEPDGSLTEDFVIPERLERRKKPAE